MLGSAAVIVMDESVCILTPCNEWSVLRKRVVWEMYALPRGNPLMNKILKRSQWIGREEDISLLLDICDTLGARRCGLGEATTKPAVSGFGYLEKSSSITSVTVGA